MGAASGSDGGRSPRRCALMPSLSSELAHFHQQEGTIIATFTNAQAHAFALNWARQLHAIGLSSLVGASEDLGPAARHAFADARGGLFCAAGAQMRRNGQAGRWLEVLPLLRFGLNVLLSDSDIGWFRSPLAYFAAVRQAHPRVELLLCSDYVGNGYSTKPLPGGSGGDLDLDVWGNAKVSSINIGVMYAYADANRSVGALVAAWAEAVVEPGGLASWDQGPINTRVLRPGLAGLSGDDALALVGRGKAHQTALGILPMLQFATSFTYFIHARTRQRAGASAYSLHAIFSHGKSAERKVQILREAALWHDAPAYYEEGRWLQLAPEEEDAGALDESRGGVGLLLRQLGRFYHGVRLARLLNRTLVLPRLRCGDAPMLYPCYGWYHRAMVKDAKWNGLKVPMPEYCPTYYWLGALAEVPWREPGFLRRPRAAAAAKGSVAALAVCAGGAGGRGCAAGGAGAARVEAVPAGASAVAWKRAARRLGDARLLVVRGAARLLDESGGGGGGGGGVGGGAAAWHGMPAPPANNLSVEWLLRGPLRKLSTMPWWCAACSVTGAVAPLEAIFARSGEAGVAGMQQFCAAEARGELDAAAPRTCCRRRAARCAPCTADDGRRPRNASRLRGEMMGTWLPVLAALTPAPDAARPDWQCTADPTCMEPEFGCKTCNKGGKAAQPKARAQPAARRGAAKAGGPAAAGWGGGSKAKGGRASGPGGTAPGGSGTKGKIIYGKMGASGGGSAGAARRSG